MARRGRPIELAFFVGSTYDRAHRELARFLVAARRYDVRKGSTLAVGAGVEGGRRSRGAEWLHRVDTCLWHPGFPPSAIRSLNGPSSTLPRLERDGRDVPI